MAKTLSEDLRVRVIAAVEGGLSRNAAAARFGIAVATAVRWLRAWRVTGATAAKPARTDRGRGAGRHPGRPHHALEQLDMPTSAAALVDRTNELAFGAALRHELGSLAFAR